MAQKHTATQKAELTGCANETAEMGEVVPTHEQVRCRAYEIYQERCRNGVDGNDLADWIAAESELRAGHNEVPQRVRRDRAATGARS
ncbi:MAG: DUF2934 domain-containing protein [Phycisphaerales bacterium]|nr:DUF2934 domain-containing protein [Phycisphaerales bacterium]